MTIHARQIQLTKMLYFPLSLHCLFKNTRGIIFDCPILVFFNSTRRVFAINERLGQCDGRKCIGCIKKMRCYSSGVGFSTHIYCCVIGQSLPDSALL